SFLEGFGLLADEMSVREEEPVFDACLPVRQGLRFISGDASHGSLIVTLDSDDFSRVADLADDFGTGSSVDRRALARIVESAAVGRFGARRGSGSNLRDREEDLLEYRGEAVPCA